MTIATVVAAYQTMHGGISGVNSVPTRMPQSLTGRTLPLVFTKPGPSLESGGWEGFGGDGGYKHSRYYIVRCYVAPLASGGEYDDAYQTTLTLLQLFGQTYMASTNLNLSGAVAHLGPRILDSGALANLQWATGSEFYHGFEFRIETVVKV